MIFFIYIKSNWFEKRKRNKRYNGKNIYISYDKEKNELEKLEDTTSDAFDIDKESKKLMKYEYIFTYNKEANYYYLTRIQNII